MIWRLVLSLSLAVLLAGCESPYKKTDAEEKRVSKDFSKDPTFQAFVGRLKIAVVKKDRPMLTSLMTSDFGYRWDNPPPGETAFDYWEQNNIWPEISRVLQDKFEPNDTYMVAPHEVITNPNYAGYRAGIRLVGGSWRFAYFVPAESGQ